MSRTDPPSIARTAVRQGVSVVKTLIRPVQPGEQGADPWLTSEQQSVNWQKGKQIARRGAGVAVLLGLAALGALILLPLVLLLGLGTANGSAPAGWLLGVVMLLGLVGLIWTGLQARNLLRPPPPAPNPNDVPEESDLLTLLREYESTVSEQARPAFHATVLATRDALRATANEPTLTRESFDARQTARSDLPELLSTYRALPAGSGRDQEFLEQLRLIETRMQEVRVGQQKVQERQMHANRKYLREKYQPDTEHTNKGND